MNKRLLLLCVVFYLTSSCCSLQLDSTHISMAFSPEITQDSLWLFTPIVKFADYSDTFDEIAIKELEPLFNNNIVHKNELRSKHLIENLNIKQVDQYIKSLRRTTVNYWIVYSINIDKIDPFEIVQPKINNDDEPLIAYLRIFKVSSGMQVYHQEIRYSGNSSDDSDPLFVPFCEKYYQKLLKKALNVLKKDMGK